MNASVAREPERLLILGLDSVPASLLFDRYRRQMPHVDQLLSRSTYGNLRSTDPPITVPAWAVMFSGMNPGSLGLYGFRHRRPWSYSDMYTPTSRTLRHPMLWDHLSREGRRVCIMGMPPGYPPPAVNGVYVSDFLTPDSARDFVAPASLRDEIDRVAGGYEFDVEFRVDDREGIAESLYRMTRKHFAVARHLWARERWDLFALHEIAPDRLHHTFWKYIDPSHPKHEDQPRFRSLVEGYYELLDREIGSLLEDVPSDVRVLLLSDHGSQAMRGGFCVNDWLIERGYLTLAGPRPAPGTPLEDVKVDWTRTRAWGAGGYYARIFFNVKGREPEGVLDATQIPQFDALLRKDLHGIRAPDGSPLDVEVFSPEERYGKVLGDPPDLMVYFGGLTWRSAGTIGHPSLYLDENDTGPDDAVHSLDGIYSISDPKEGAGQPGPTEQLIDIAPTLLRLSGLPVPSDMQGRAIERFA